MSLDIGPKSIEMFADILKTAKTVVWNGPMGVFEMSNYAKGTIGVCDAISKLTEATTIVGGGDSAAAAIQFGYASKFTHISTGGGASLEYLEGKALPGVEIVANK
jgi:phosphoglycerate kinase